MNTLLAVLLLLTYVGMIYYAVKGGNLMIGFFAMAILWIIIGGIPYNVALNDIIEKGAENYGVTAVVIIFGSWFGRVIVDTGIAGFIIRKTVELGGDKPLVITILVSIVTSLIFTSTYGVGAVIAIGVIIFPILLSIGVPKRVAVSAYTISVGAGMYINVALFKQMQMFFPSVQYDNAYLKFGFAAMAIQIVVVIAMLIFNLRPGKLNHAWAVPTQNNSPIMEAPAITFIVPIIPVIMAVAFKWPPIPSILLAIFFAFLFTKKLSKPKEALTIISKTMYDGVADVGLLLGMLFMLNMFTTVAGKDAAVLGSLFNGVIPKVPMVLALALGILAPIALFRGPLMVWGAGGATVAILSGMKIFAPQLLFPLLLVPTVSMAISTCPTQSWNLWAINYAKVSIKEFLKTGVVWAWAIVIINEMIAVSLFR
ncbi:MAG: citrate transporter [Desulfitobacteriaceae bacterium]